MPPCSAISFDSQLHEIKRFPPLTSPSIPSNSTSAASFFYRSRSAPLTGDASSKIDYRDRFARITSEPRCTFKCYRRCCIYGEGALSNHLDPPTFFLVWRRSRAYVIAVLASRLKVRQIAARSPRHLAFFFHLSFPCYKIVTSILEAPKAWSSRWSRRDVTWAPSVDGRWRSRRLRISWSLEGEGGRNWAHFSNRDKSNQITIFWPDIIKLTIILSLFSLSLILGKWTLMMYGDCNEPPLYRSTSCGV